MKISDNTEKVLCKVDRCIRWTLIAIFGYALLSSAIDHVLS